MTIDTLKLPRSGIKINLFIYQITILGKLHNLKIAFMFYSKTLLYRHLREKGILAV